jgi:hypothetical protein
MKNISLWTLPLVSLLLLLLACDPEAKNEDGSRPSDSDQSEMASLSYGTMAGQTYVNEFFGLELPLPEGWYVQSRADNAQLEQVEGNVLDFGPADSLGAVPIDRLRVTYLLVAFQHAPGTQEDGKFNPGLNLIANYLQPQDSINSATSYLEQVREELLASGMFQGGDNIQALELSGQTFQQMDMSFSFEGMDIKQRYLVLLLQDYALQLTLSYTSPEEEATLKEVVENLKFQ